MTIYAQDTEVINGNSEKLIIKRMNVEIGEKDPLDILQGFTIIDLFIYEFNVTH
jgi:hypothetical protein